MSLRLPTAPATVPERPVVMRDSSGQLLVLLELRTVDCDNCRFGTVHDTVWSTLDGQAERMRWCGSCFNAISEPVDLDAEEQLRLHSLTERLLVQDPLECWAAARSAVEALQRREHV